MNKLLFILLIIILATVLRLWNLQKRDVTDDETHYTIDSQRLTNRDPYISIRYHPLGHPSPSIGHPFLAQVVTSVIFKIGGFSNFSARLPYALSGILTVLVLFIFDKKLGGNIAIMSAAFLAVIPFAVRYNRDAHLDSLFALWTTIVVLCIWKYLGSHKRNWLIISGIAAGFAISTKLDGIISLIIAGLLLLIGGGSIKTMFNLNNFKKLLAKLIYIFIPASIISFLLNDPSAYINGILVPSDQNYKLFSQVFWAGVLNSLSFWPKALFYLLSPAILILWIISIFILIREKGVVGRFLLVWQFLTLGLLIFHQPGISGEYGLLPAIPTVVISIAFGLKKILKRKAAVLAFGVILLILPFTFRYGLYLKPLPYYSETYEFNRTIKDNFYQSIINRVNELTPQNGKLFLLPQTKYPIFSLRPDISWSYFGGLEEYDIAIVSDSKLLGSEINRFTLSEKMFGFQDGENIVRFIFIKNRSL